MDPSRHTDQRNFIEGMLRWIPGFRGYLEKEYRRESDQLARNHIADSLQSTKPALDSYMRQLVSSARLDALPEGERLKAKIDKLGAKVRGEVQGYSGFFDYVKVNEELLDQVYQLDMSLADEAKSFTNSMNLLAQKSADPQAAFAAMIQAVEQLEQKFNQRGQLLAGLGDG